MNENVNLKQVGGKYKKIYFIRERVLTAKTIEI